MPRRGARKKEKCGHCGLLLYEDRFADHKLKFYNWTTKIWRIEPGSAADIETVSAAVHDTVSTVEQKGSSAEQIDAQENKHEDDSQSDAEEVYHNNSDIAGDWEWEVAEEVSHEEPITQQYGQPSRTQRYVAFYRLVRLWQINFKVSVEAVRALLWILFSVLCQFDQANFPEPPHSGDGICHGLKKYGVVEKDRFLGMHEYVSCRTCFKLYSGDEVFTSTTT